jgi:hypothetical protein
VPLWKTKGHVCVAHAPTLKLIDMKLIDMNEIWCRGSTLKILSKFNFDSYFPLFHTKLKSNFLLIFSKKLIYIWEVLSSNIVPEIGYLDLDFHGFHQSLQAVYNTITWAMTAFFHTHFLIKYSYAISIPFNIIAISTVENCC